MNADRGGSGLADRWALVEPHRDRLLSIARARCNDPADAEDCVHEAMVRVVEFPGLDPNRVSQLLTSVTVRLAVDTHRDRARSRRAGVALAVAELPDPGPEVGVCDRDEAAWVARQARTLPERQRAVLAVRASGADGGETAARLSLSYKSVESAMSRARSTLRLALASTMGLLAAFYRRTNAEHVPVYGAAMSVAAGSLVVALTGAPPAATAAPSPALGERAAVGLMAHQPGHAGAVTPTTRVVHVAKPAPAAAPAEAPAAAPAAKRRSRDVNPPVAESVHLTFTDDGEDEDDGFGPDLDPVLDCLEEIEVSRRVVGCDQPGTEETR